MAINQVLRIPILPAGLVNAHLVVHDGSAMLVDAGLPGTEARVEKALRRHGLGFRDIRLIVITHAHVDHAGNAARLRDLSGAPIVAHRADLPYYRREAEMRFCPTGWFGRLFIRTGLMYQPYAPFQPDILLDNQASLPLAPFGFDGMLSHTPGHTAGSLSVELADQQALVGDLIASGILLGGLIRTGHAKQPPFEDDPRLVSQALEAMLARGHRQFFMGHGGPLPAREVARHAGELSRYQSHSYPVPASK